MGTDDRRRKAEREGDEERAAAERARAGGERIRFRLWIDGTDALLAATDEDAAVEEAQEEGAEGYESEAATFWVHATLQRSEDSGATWEDARFLRIEVPPQEPDCLDDRGHEWTDEVVRGNGGGIRSTDRCAHCGVRRTYDTWAQDPVDGSQGHKAWSFQRKEEA